MVLKRATFTVFARGWSNEGANVIKKNQIPIKSNSKFHFFKGLSDWNLKFGIYSKLQLKITIDNFQISFFFWFIIWNLDFKKFGIYINKSGRLFFVCS
jgi:hypothetical protein